jgi:hypothetical protein
MNKIEKMFDSDPAVFAKAYFKYLTDVIKGIDEQEIARFVGTLLDARERSATVFLHG